MFSEITRVEDPRLGPSQRGIRERPETLSEDVSGGDRPVDALEKVEAERVYGETSRDKVGGVQPVETVGYERVPIERAPEQLALDLQGGKALGELTLAVKETAAERQLADFDRGLQMHVEKGDFKGAMIWVRDNNRSPFMRTLADLLSKDFTYTPTLTTVGKVGEGHGVKLREGEDLPCFYTPHPPELILTP